MARSVSEKETEEKTCSGSKTTIFFKLISLLSADTFLPFWIDQIAAKYEYSSKKKENNQNREKYLNLIMEELDVPNGFC